MDGSNAVASGTSDNGEPAGAASRLRQWALRLTRQVRAVRLAARDPRIPRGARLLALVLVAYAASPIDLIPDFIPVLGYLDDLILLPLGVWLFLRMIPAEVWRECQERAAGETGDLPPNRVAAGCIVVVWLVVGALLVIVFL